MTNGPKARFIEAVLSGRWWARIHGPSNEELQAEAKAMERRYQARQRAIEVSEANQRLHGTGLKVVVSHG